MGETCDTLKFETQKVTREVTRAGIDLCVCVCVCARVEILKHDHRILFLNGDMALFYLLSPHQLPQAKLRVVLFVFSSSSLKQKIKGVGAEPSTYHSILLLPLLYPRVFSILIILLSFLFLCSSVVLVQHALFFCAAVPETEHQCDPSLIK